MQRGDGFDSISTDQVAMECYYSSSSLACTGAKESSFMSMIILPKASDAKAVQFNGWEDTLARANAWLNCAQASGVPILFLNVQAEALVTKITGKEASHMVSMGPLSGDLSSLANTSLCGFDDYHGVDIGVLRAVRLWYTPAGGEHVVEIKLKEGDAKLGFAISRTDEGFLYVSSIAEDEANHDTPASRSELVELYREAGKASKLLVISRVSDEKVLPWMVSPCGAIRCFDTVSLSHKLSLHRHALQPILLHVFMWNIEIHRPPTSSTSVAPPRAPMMRQPEEKGGRGRKDGAGEGSFRFQNVHKLHTPT